MTTKTSTKIAQAFSLIGSATAGLPFAHVLPGQRQGLAGRLFPDGPCFVESVGEALAGTGSPLAEEIADHQAAANAWFYLRARLLLLGQLASDSYLFHQSEAIRKAQLASEQAPNPDPQAQLDLLPAALVWYAYLQVQREQKARQKEARQQAQAPTQSPPAPSRGAKQRQLRQKERRRTAMDRLFEAYRTRRLHDLGQADLLNPPPSPIDERRAGDETVRTDSGSEVADGGLEGNLRQAGRTGPRRIA